VTLHQSHMTVGLQLKAFCITDCQNDLHAFLHAYWLWLDEYLRTEKCFKPEL